MICTTCPRAHAWGYGAADTIGPIFVAPHVSEGTDVPARMRHN
jgi:hypothetical protein